MTFSHLVCVHVQGVGRRGTGMIKHKHLDVILLGKEYGIWPLRMGNGQQDQGYDSRGHNSRMSSPSKG